MDWVGVVTDAGASLLASYAQTGTALNVSRIATGTGYVETDALRRQRTSLVSPADEGAVVSMKAVDGGMQFGMQVGPNEGDAPYLMKEVGLIVDAETGGVSTPVLLAYFNNSDGVSIPTVESFRDFVYVLSATLVIDNTTPFNFTIPPDALVSQETLNAFRAALEAQIAENVAKDQGIANARKFLIVGSDGKVSPALVTMEGASAGADGKAGLVPAPAVGQNSMFLRGDGQWAQTPDTKYSEGSGIGINGTTISLKASGVSQGTYGPPDDVVGTDGNYIIVPLITVDQFGRITSITTKKFTAKNTTYLNGTGLDLTGTTFSLKNSGVTAGTYGPSGDVTGNNNNTVKIPQIVIDQYGRITNVVERTITFKDTTNFLPLTGGTVTGATTFSNTTASSSTSTGAVVVKGGLGVAKNIYGAKVFGGVWNDYAEFRKGTTAEGGYCLMECPDGWMRKTTHRLQAGCRLTSDTYGMSMGQTAEAKTPIGVSGRVLVYPYEDISKFHIGDAVCSAPGGKVSVMSRREIRKWPDRIVGIVSEIPTYKEWKCGTEEDEKTVDVNGRLWVYVR